MVLADMETGVGWCSKRRKRSWSEWSRKYRNCLRRAKEATRYPMDPLKEVPKKKGKEEGVKEEREASPASSPESSRVVETEEVKGLQDWRSKRPENMFHNAPWRQSQGKGKGYSGKRDERDLLSFGSTGTGVSQTFKGFTNMSLSILTRVQQFPQFPEKTLKGMRAGNPTPLSIKRPQVNCLKITVK